MHSSLLKSLRHDYKLLKEKINEKNDYLYNEQIIINKEIYQTEATILFADLGGCTKLIDEYDSIFSSWLLKSYISCMTYVAKKNNGKIIGFEGDGIVIAFFQKNKEDQAVTCAFNMQWIIEELLQPEIDKLFPEKKYSLSHVVGIDTSKHTVLNTNMEDNSFLLWVGRGINYSANFTKIHNIDYSTYISEVVFEKLSDYSKHSNKRNIWECFNVNKKVFPKIRTAYRTSYKKPLT